MMIYKIHVDTSVYELISVHNKYSMKQINI